MKTRPWVDVSELESPGDPHAEDAVKAASSILFQLSGQKFGGVFKTTEQYVCETTGAPTGCHWDAGVGAYWNPVIGSYAVVQGPSMRSTRLVPGTDIRLRQRPVRQITEVSVYGEVKDPSTYKLYNRGILHPLPGSGWSLCSAPIITYEYGILPPALGRLAAKKIADELVLAMNGGDCRLPSSVTSVSRQGLSFDIYDPQTFLDHGRIGIYEADMFIATFNPASAKKRARVFSPDLPRPYRGD